MSFWIDIEAAKPAKFRELVQFLAAEIDVDAVLQFFLAVLSLAAIAMIAIPGPLHRWGFVIGLASQPFWIASSWRARTRSGGRAWGMIVLAWAYVFVWVLGIGERFA